MTSAYLKQYYESSPWKGSVFCWYPFEDGVNYETVMDPDDLSTEALLGYRKKLGPHGRLLLAFENPFGLRYWNGKRSPVTGQSFDSITGRDGSAGMAELKIRLAQAGFAGQKWYFPLTDHWFTSEVYSESYMPDELLNQRFTPYMADNEVYQFDETPMYRGIIRNGAFALMCGAYMVEARASALDAACPVDYAAVTAYRAPQSRFATTLRNDGTVRKTPLCPEGQAGIRRIMRINGELSALGVNVLPMRVERGALVMPRVNLPTLWDYWAKKHTRGELAPDEMFGHFDRIRDCIYLAAKNGGCYWELVPANCFFDEKTDELIFFDQEYCWDGVTPDAAVVRALWALKYSPVFSCEPRAAEWLEHLKARYGVGDRWKELSLIADGKMTAGVFNNWNTPLDKATAAAAKIIKDMSDHRRLRQESCDRLSVNGGQA